MLIGNYGKTTDKELIKQFEAVGKTPETQQGNAIERSVAVANLVNLIDRIKIRNIPEFKMDIVFCRRNPEEINSFIGFSKKDVTAIASTDPAATGVAIIARDIKTNKHIEGLNLVLTRPLMIDLFGDSINYTIMVSCEVSKKEEEKTNDPTAPKKPEGTLEALKEPISTEPKQEEPKSEEDPFKKAAADNPMTIFTMQESADPLPPSTGGAGSVQFTPIQSSQLGNSKQNSKSNKK